ncbi:molybdate ABC transporter permease subunit [Desulfovibrio subterraneus]|jgi:molybdate transport system permease protein|uniref:Molybdenum transport system permease n=1 Tax=Desulfovibrio subterraneus TaxID=2718620 RepID=A0A7J0BJ96_9BACT|nr:molybdate ABC transporter permease subunit [Desulfovibrio subterraneus]WBF67920.1 molybdate ABC transporter permease subunit [Desulfovibrio subterraneus]GFM33787.1 molybdenum ABC transporter permease subunit [Desulfovibrio subterraneus]
MQLQEVLIPLLLTLKVVFWSTLIAAGAGIIAAYLLCRKNFPGRDWLDAACSLPLVLPPTVLGYYLIVVIGRNGLLGQWLEQELGIRLMFTWQGAVVAAAVVSFPLVFKSARAAFESVPPSYLQAARILGAGEWEIFFRVTLPLAFRGVLAGTMLAFARGMGEFGATLMVAGNLPGRTQTLSLAVYSAVQAGNDGLATILVCVVSIVCVVLLVVTGKLVSPNNA